MRINPSEDISPERNREISRGTINSTVNIVNSDTPNIQRSSTVASELKENEVYEVKYYLKYMAVALSIHGTHLIFGPLALPLLHLIYNHNLLHNMLFKWSKIYFLLEFPGWVYVVTTAVALSIDLSKIEVLYSSMITYGIIIILRNILVSVKYGYYTQRQWETLKERRFTEEEINGSLLLRSWIKVPDKVAERELSISFKRMHIKPERMRLKFKELSEKTIATLGDYMTELPDLSDSTIPIDSISRYLINQITEAVKTPEIKLISACAALYTLIPFILLFYRYNKEMTEISWMGWMYMIMLMPNTYLYCRGFLLFILVGVYDFSRKKLLLAQCTALISRVDNVYLKMNDEYPRLDMSDANTVLSWYCMRSAFLDFGKRFTLRVFLYSSLALPVCLIVIIVIIAMTFGIVGTSFNFLYIPGVFLVVIVLIVICYMVAAAIALNKYFAIHRDILLTIITELSGKEKNEKSSKTQKSSKDSISTIWIIYEKLVQSEKLHPVSIMGITANSSLYAKLGTVAISGVAALTRLLLS